MSERSRVKAGRKETWSQDSGSLFLENQPHTGWGGGGGGRADGPGCGQGLRSMNPGGRD